MTTAPAVAQSLFHLQVIRLHFSDSGDALSRIRNALCAVLAVCAALCGRPAAEHSGTAIDPADVDCFAYCAGAGQAAAQADGAARPDLHRCSTTLPKWQSLRSVESGAQRAEEPDVAPADGAPCSQRHAVRQVLELRGGLERRGIFMPILQLPVSSQALGFREVSPRVPGLLIPCEPRPGGHGLQQQIY